MAYHMSWEIKTAYAGDDGNIATQEWNVCDIEIEIVTFVYEYNR